MKEPKIKIEKLARYRPQAVNANSHTPRGIQMLDDAMSEDGYVAPMTAAADGEMIDGSARLERSFERFGGEAIVIEHDGTRPIIAKRTDIKSANTPAAKRIALRANRIPQVDLEWDASILAQLKDEGVELSGMFTEKELAAILPKEGHTIDESAARLTLAQRFVVPPFSVLDARQGYWQDRKRAWLALGIQSELGRGGGIVPNGTRRPAEQDGCYMRVVRKRGGQGEVHNQHESMGEGERSNRTRSRLALSPGGSPRPAMKLRNGHTVRGDGRGREI